MKITISKEFDNAQDAIDWLQAVGAGPVVNSADAPAAPAARRGRPRKPVTIEQTPESAAPAAVVADEAAAPVNSEPVAADPTPTPTPASVLQAAVGDKDAAMAALRQVFNTKGAPAAQKLLSAFNVTRFSELTADQYGAFIAAAV
jgi:hypothetical protein